MPKFPVDARTRWKPRISRVAKTRVSQRANPDGSKTPLTLPNYRTIKGSTLRTILSRTGISRDEFLAAFDRT